MLEAPLVGEISRFHQQSRSERNRLLTTVTSALPCDPGPTLPSQRTGLPSLFDGTYQSVRLSPRVSIPRDANNKIQEGRNATKINVVRFERRDHNHGPLSCKTCHGDTA